ncbi:hypothetical protein TSUD_138740 [Trifolium subterraneum]|uniref:Protein kinase domain-containing protein n=1 Tax=Trifolium subterraneum TaxID=3900 RepID=A0A2Z6PSI9_TRISU|nr:hypothetical protein TSUD_138740 [Trifolium subterraneum]
MECKNSIQVPGLKNPFIDNSSIAVNILNEGFEVNWSGVDQDTCDGCTKSGERCGYNTSENAVMCVLKKSAPPTNGTWDWKKKLIVGVVASAVLATLAVITAIYFYRRQNNGSSPESNVRSLSLSSQPSENFPDVKIFTPEDLASATNQFDTVLGSGITSTVYEGNLEGGHRVAVKVLNYKNDAQFITEVQNQAKLSHPNLVVLHGCTSIGSNQHMIVFEYVGNGTLYGYLHDDRGKYVRLTWDNRMTIAVEIASVLTYLHASNIVHRDIKSSNIFLNDNLHAKLGDFGIARHFPEDQSHVETDPHGTLGYVDPEYHRESKLTHKSDVFSFGVVLIELISSKHAYVNKRDDQHLSAMAKNKLENNALDELVDDSLGFDLDQRVEEMMRGVAELAVRCVQDSRDARPSMDEVLVALQTIQNAGQLEAVDNYNPDDDDFDGIVELLNC